MGKTTASPTKTAPSRVERSAHLRWIPISKMRVSAQAQRELNDSRVNKMAADFDLERLGNPTVSERDGFFWIIDGNHRVNTLKAIGWGDQQIQCWTFTGLTEQDEAEAFLKLNDTLTVDAFSKFRVGIAAGRPVECEIDRIVRAQGLCVSRDKIDGAISAVETLRRLYVRGGHTVLGRSLRIIRDAYGDDGFQSTVIDGIGYLCQRYNGSLKDEIAVVKLRKAMGGLSALTNKAERLRLSTGNSKSQCIAAAAVEIINAGRGGEKLPSWWMEAGVA